jgi:hypothetical protein
MVRTLHAARTHITTAVVPGQAVDQACRDRQQPGGLDGDLIELL